ncbi:unnamed protein product [Linum trigynum]|uniref:Uncharacterized protein n=1 Tax=Linum trigynum TaxID=586398 RepID=A0AAV2E7R3_9ROSI
MKEEVSMILSILTNKEKAVEVKDGDVLRKDENLCQPHGEGTSSNKFDSISSKNMYDQEDLKESKQDNLHDLNDLEEQEINTTLKGKASAWVRI